MLILAWVAVTYALCLGIAYVPGALDLVDDYRWGRFVSSLFIPTVLPLTAGGFLLTRKKYLFGAIVTVLVLLAYATLSAYTIALARAPSAASSLD